MPDIPNPLNQSFSEMVTEWERNFDAFANQVMGTEAYSQAMNEMQKAQLAYQKNMMETMSQQLSAFNMPTREDVLQLAEAIRQMDRRLERIEDKLSANDSPKKKKKKPSRTRKPPAIKGEGEGEETSTNKKSAKGDKKT